MITHQQARGLIGQQLWAEHGQRVGIIGQVFLDDRTQQPEWITVHTGLFGSKEKFVPLAHATWHETGLSVPYSEQIIKKAPTIDVEAGTLTCEEEACLYDYYELTYVLSGPTSATAQPREEASSRPASMPTVNAAVGTPGALPQQEQHRVPIAAGVGASARTAEGAHPLSRRERIHPILARGAAMSRAQRLRRFATSHLSASPAATQPKSGGSSSTASATQDHSTGTTS